MIFSRLVPRDIDDVVQLLTYDHFHGLDMPSFYTVSSLVNLYGDVCGSVRIDDALVAVSLNCPYLKRDGIYVYAFAVSRDQQRKGVGSFLFASMVKMLQEMGYKKISLRVLIKNPEALQFWMKMGFICLPMQLSDSVENFLERDL